MEASELIAAREGMGMTKTEFARAANEWWRDKSGSPASYDQSRIGHFECGSLGVPVKIQWFISDAG